MNDYSYLVAWFACIGVLISTFEYIYVRREFLGDGIFSWHVLQTRYSRGSPLLASALDTCCSPKGTLAIIGMRGLCAALVVLHVARIPYLTVIVLLLISTLFINYRLGAGSDGSDQMLIVILSGLTVSNLFPSGSRYQIIGIGFIAAQALLSYLVAGVAKVSSSVWRNGSAIHLISNHVTYGSRWLERWLRNKSGLQK